MSTKEQFLGYAHAFLVAADGHATAAKEKGLDGEVNGMMCIIALQNSVVGAAKVLGWGHPAVKKCQLQAPDLKDVRDMLTHFDAYAAGKGKLQKKAPVEGPENGGEPATDVAEDDAPPGFGWMTMWNTDETMLILNRAKGEAVPREYEVPIHDALKSVAALVHVAAESIGKKPSPLLTKIIGTVEGS